MSILKALAGRPSLAVMKLASCGGCQLRLLRLVPALLGRYELSSFPELSRRERPGPWDVVVVEGSVTTEQDRLRLVAARRSARTLLALGACATSGGVQASPGARAGARARAAGLDVLPESTPLRAHVDVDFEITGCPVDAEAVGDALARAADGWGASRQTGAVCLDCKRAGVPCLTVAGGALCLGPVTRGGCDAACPRVGLGCFGCGGALLGAPEAALRARWEESGGAEAILDGRRVGAAGCAQGPGREVG